MNPLVSEFPKRAEEVEDANGLTKERAEVHCSLKCVAIFLNVPCKIPISFSKRKCLTNNFM